MREATVVLAALAAALALMIPSPAAAGSLPSTRHVMPTVEGASMRASGGGNLLYHGGTIQKTPKVFVTFWAWGGSDPSGEAPYLASFLGGLGGSPYGNIQTQYTETVRGAITNPSPQLLGTWRDDTGIVPLNPDQYMEDEVLASVAHFGYDPDANYVIATPHGHSTSGFGTVFCAWHDSLPVGADNFAYSSPVPVAFTNLPYITDAGYSCGMNFVNPGAAGKLDGVSIVMGHEYAETITDPGITSWYDDLGYETGDKCAWQQLQDVTLTTGSFAVQPEWSNAGSHCVASYP
jgi:serine protease